jgi:hypothetical protein
LLIVYGIFYLTKKMYSTWRWLIIKPKHVVEKIIKEIHFNFCSDPLQSWSSPEGSRKLLFSDFLTMTQDGDKVISLTQRPHLPPRNTPGTHFYQKFRQPQDHSAIRRIYINEKFHHTIWDRTIDLLICSAIP